MESPQTPTPARMEPPMRITQAQKQAIIANLELELHERARRLRFEYEMQARLARTRLAFRITRIPTALRKANMGELFEKFNEMEEAKKEAKKEPAPTISEPTKLVNKGPEPATLAVADAPTTTPALQATQPKTRGTKRTSAEMGGENAPIAAKTRAANPKSGARGPAAPAASAPAPARKPTARKPSAPKPKPTAAAPAPAAAVTRGRRAARPALVVEPKRVASNSSTLTNLSSEPTLVRGKKAPAPKTGAAAATKLVASKVEGAPPGGRFLRKRN